MPVIECSDGDGINNKRKIAVAVDMQTDRTHIADECRLMNPFCEA